MNGMAEAAFGGFWPRVFNALRLNRLERFIWVSGSGRLFGRFILFCALFGAASEDTACMELGRPICQLGCCVGGVE